MSANRMYPPARDVQLVADLIRRVRFHTRQGNQIQALEYVVELHYMGYEKADKLDSWVLRKTEAPKPEDLVWGFRVGIMTYWTPDRELARREALGMGFPSYFKPLAMSKMELFYAKYPVTLIREYPS